MKTSLMTIKVFAIFVLSFAALALSPKTVNQVCSRINTPTTLKECYQIGNSGYFNKLALGACDRFQGEQNTIQCMRVIAQKDIHHNQLGIVIV